MRLFYYIPTSVCDLIDGAIYKNTGLAIIAALIFTPIVFSHFYDHDWQRLFQVGVACLALVFLVVSADRRAAVPAECRWGLGLIVALAFLSCVLSAKPYWAFCEVALAFACCAIALYVAQARRQAQASLDHAFVCFVIALCALKVLQFFSSTLAGYVTSTGTLDLDLLIEGFSNRRFYGQFQTMTLPLLALPLLLPGLKRSIRHSIFALLACWWLIAIVGGTRGTWLGMAVAAAVISKCGLSGRQWVRWQILAALAGLCLYGLLFSLLSDLLHVKLVNSAGGRLTVTLSAREIIWDQAWEMIKSRPILGFGPMHFANSHNLVGAHPHQAILQWASEWGVPSTLLVGGLGFRGIWATIRLARERAASPDKADLLRICLLASLLGALTQSMVDGVIVMPYSQIWLAIVVGWLIGLHRGAVERGPGPAWLRQGWMAMMVLSIGLLVYEVARDFPNLDARSAEFDRDLGGTHLPRFWRQGVIATKADLPLPPH